MSLSIDKQMEEKGFFKVSGMAVLGDVAVVETSKGLLSPKLSTESSVKVFNEDSEGGWQLYRKADNKQELEVYGSDWPAGSIIEMFGEQLRILENNGDRGRVEALDGEFISNRFYWEYQGDSAILISINKLLEGV